MKSAFARGFASRSAARIFDRYSGAPRAPALGAFPHARRRRARHHLDPRRPRGDARGLGRGRAEGEPGARLQRPRCRHRRKRLSRSAPSAARCSSAGSPTGSAARSCSSPPSRSTSRRPPLTGLSWSGWSFWLFRFLTGAGIGGEYTAINSTIQELVPARYRGFTDLVINGSFWIGAALGAGAAIVLLDPHVIDPETGWRACFLIGAALGLVVFLMRMWIPESPRWLALHGREAQARVVADGIEARLPGRRTCARAGRAPTPRSGSRRAATRRSSEVFATLFHRHRRRTLRRPRADGGAGLLLQRDLLHLRAGAHEILRGQLGRCRLVYPAVRDRQFPRAPPPRPPLRHARAPRHDRRYLCACRACCCSPAAPSSRPGSYRPLARRLPGW